MEFSRQEYWSGLPLPSPEDLSYLEIVPMSLLFPAFVGGCFYLCATWEDPNYGHIDFFPVIFQFSAPVFCIRTFPETFYLSPCLHYFLHPNLSYDHSPRARHLECEVKWVLGSVTMNKASGGDGIPAELFQILKLLLKCCTQYVSKFGKFSSGHRTEKGQFSFQFQRKAMPKNVETIE